MVVVIIIVSSFFCCKCYDIIILTIFFNFLSLSSLPGVGVMKYEMMRDNSNPMISYVTHTWDIP